MEPWARRLGCVLALDKCPDVDKELWRLGPDGSGVFWRCTSVSRCRQGTMAPWARRPQVCFGVLCANKKKEEVKRDFGDLRIEKEGSEGRACWPDTPLVFKRVLFRTEGTENPREKKEDKKVRGRAERKDKRVRERERAKPALNKEKGLSPEIGVKRR
ncbi:hypothetical protein TNCV_2006091 [Trichonephila clavipes]|nr:hypothetical protein TNCV_2006091 [Trichonephila clavipes]